MPERALIAAQVSQKRRIEEKLQAELASEFHVCEKTIRNLETSHANLRLKTLKRLTTNMRMSVSAFLRLDPLSGSDPHTNCEEIDPQDISAEIAALSSWLKIFLRFSGETQQDLSAHSGVCLDTVNRIIRQLPSCNPTLSTLQNFAAYMSITVSELLDTTLNEDDMRKLLEERIHL